MSAVMIFTDLDGTLLDHHSYQYDAALPALAEINAKHYPLILNSSKTRAEIQTLHRELQLSSPFICENGAAIYWQDHNEWQCKSFSMSRDNILPILQQLRSQYDYRFTGFMDCNDEQIAQMTGLDITSAHLAAQRSFTEPLLWQDTDERRAEFLSRLAPFELRGVQGGRFLSVMGHFDKATAMQWLIQQAGSTDITTIALGDSPNDLDMLQAADIAVVIKSARSYELIINKPRWVIRTNESGPAGWQEAMNQILPTLNQ